MAKMKTVLEDLFFGEIQPNTGHVDPNKMQVITENEEILIKLLDGKERKLFLDLINTQSEISGESAVEDFIYGFKLGARMIAETLLES